MLGISYRQHKTNEYVWQQANFIAGHLELLLSIVKLRKLSWPCLPFDTLPKIILEGKVVIAEEDRVNQVRRTPVAAIHTKKCPPLEPPLEDTINEWTVVAAHCRRQKSMDDHCSWGVCRSTTTTLGRHRC